MKREAILAELRENGVRLDVRYRDVPAKRLELPPPLQTATGKKVDPDIPDPPAYPSSDHLNEIGRNLGGGADLGSRHIEIGLQENESAA
ncbi:MAG: hypothetical protein ACR2RB_11665 [Gammaproteobacteria bacterium]